MNENGFTVGQLAEASGVTVRTLHYYDRIGLLEPSGRTSAGHRRYSEEDVTTLYRIVALRQLGLSLSHIAGVLTDDQPIGELLQRQLEETNRSIRAHHELLARLQRGVAAAQVRAEDLFAVIGGTIELTPHRADGAHRPDDASGASIFTMLFEGLDGVHNVLRRRLGELTADNIATAGQPLLRAARFEDTYVMTVLQSKATVFEEQEWSDRLGGSETEGEAPVSASVTPAVLTEYAEAVFAATMAYVTSIDDTELTREIPGPGASALTWSMKVAELLAQVSAFAHHQAGYTSAVTGSGYP